MKGDFARHTLFALLAGVELDLRSLLTTHISPLHLPDSLYGPDLLAILTKRAGRAANGEPLEAYSSTQLLDYLDLGDTISLINKHRSSLPPEIATYIRTHTASLQRLIPIRNRVMHFRPLEHDDLLFTVAQADLFISSAPHIWNSLLQQSHRLNTDPGYVLQLSLPPSNYDSKRLTNLPTPDFDETGFVGRSQDVANILTQCKGPYPVLSIIGEGGVGKTATALKVAYDILDDPTSPFEAVVWVTSKTTQLTSTELVRIENAITTSLGLFTAVRDVFDAGNQQDAVETVLRYLNDFPILLIIDNLETVLDERIRSFMQHLRGNSKIIITSRVGIGAFEFPYRLSPLDTQDAIRLLRATAVARNVTQISQAKESSLAKCVTELGCNPGYLKWLVAVVQAGIPIERALAERDVFLSFCMSNVYEHLNTPARELLSVMISDPTPQTMATLVYLSEMNVKVVQDGIMQLMRSCMISNSSTPLGNVFETVYELTVLARQFLQRCEPPPVEVQRRIRSKRTELRHGVEVDGKKRIVVNAEKVTLRTDSDVVAARILQEAVRSSSKGDVDGAERLLDQARSLAPDYFEVFRVQGWIRARSGQILAAKESYESAIDLQPDDAQLRYWYGTFLGRYFDAMLGLRQMEAALSIYQEDPEIRVEMARFYMFARSYERAECELGKVFETTGAGSFTLAKAWDLKVQLPLRRAEELLDERRAVDAAEALMGAMAAYEEIPEPNRDEKIRSRLDLALRLFVKVRRMASENWEGAAEFEAWIKQYKAVPVTISEEVVAGKYVGVIDYIPEDTRFGFLLSSEGSERLFFHKDSCRSIEVWKILEHGVKVRFDMGSNDTGRCAVNLSLYEET